MNQRSEQELAEGARHLGYEWRMAQVFHFHDVELKFLSHYGPHQAGANGRGEIVLLHARLVYEFLFKPRTHADDIRAEDFMDANIAVAWQRDLLNLQQQICPAFTKDWSRLNKRLFHLSYERQNLAAEWDTKTVMSELEAGLEHFRKQLTPERLALLKKAMEQEF